MLACKERMLGEVAAYCKSSTRVQGDTCPPVTGAEGAHAARVHLSSGVQCQVSYLAITCMLSWSRTLYQSRLMHIHTIACQAYAGQQCMRNHSSAVLDWLKQAPRHMHDKS